MRASTRKRLAPAVAAVAAAAMAVAGCSSGSSSKSSSGNKLEVFSYWTSGSENAALNSLFKAYNAKYPKIKINNSAVSGGGGANAQQVLQTRISGGNPPETWQTHPGDILATYTKDNLVQDLTPIFDKNNWGKVMPANVVESMKQDGKVYTAITGVHRENVLWYNKKVLAKLGVDVGSTLSFADFTAAMAKAKAAGITPFCNGDQQIFASAAIAENTLIAFVGADAAKQLYVGKGWDSSKVADAMKAYSHILDNENSDHTALTWDEAVKRLGEGKCAFNDMADSAYGELLHDGFKDDVDFGYVPFPGTDSIFLAVGDSFVVSSKAAHKTNADHWIEVLESPTAQLAFSKLKGSIPVRTDIDVSSLGKYQQTSAADYKAKEILNTMTFGQSVTPSQEQAYYDAITAFDQSRDVNAFVTAMKAAFSG